MQFDKFETGKRLNSSYEVQSEQKEVFSNISI